VGDKKPFRLEMAIKMLKSCFLRNAVRKIVIACEVRN